MTLRRFTVLAALCLPCLSGCGNSSDHGRQPLRGSITIDGVELQRGAISLRPLEGHAAPAAVTTVENGSYRFTRENGPLPGPYAVKINIDPESDQGKAILQGAAAPAGDDPGPIGPKGGALVPSSSAQRRPVAPKLHWELEYTVPEDGSGKKDFELSN